MPKTSEAMRKAIDKYNKESIDEIKLRVPKGRKAELQAYVKEQGESLNGFINKAISEKIERDNP